jgi:chromosome segregation ATPase
MVDSPNEAMTGRLDDLPDRVEALDQTVVRMSISIDSRFDDVSEAIVEQRRYTEFAFESLRGEMAQRFDAVERRLDAVERRLDAVEHRLDAVEHRLDAVERRLDAVERRLDAVERRLDAVEHRLDAVEHRLDAIERRLDVLERRFDRFDEKLDQLIAIVSRKRKRGRR